MNDYTNLINDSISCLYKSLEPTLSPYGMERVKDAFELANEAHKEQRRRSGLPYIVHPIAVAQIVASELELGANPVIAALLHDVVEDTDYTLDDISQRFGDDVAHLVDIVTKRKIGKQVNSKQVENFRQLLESMQHARYARINGKLASVKTVLHRGDCVEIGLSDEIQIRPDWQGHTSTYKAQKAVNSYLGKQEKPKYTRCPHCNPLPGDEVIGFGQDEEHLTLHKRACPEAIRLASQHGNHIHEAELPECPDCLYPVRIMVRAVDRYHLISDLIECITEKLKLSMTALSSESVDNIGTCTIDFGIHSAGELRFVIKSINEIEGVDEVIVQQ